jgi:hypothetical protein
MDIKIRTAQKINSDLYREMLNDIKIFNSERIVNEGTIDYQCDYYTIYYHQGSKCVGLYNVTHCSCNGTEDDQPDTFADNDKLLIVDTIEDFYKKCIEDKITKEYSKELCDSYINWFEENFYDVTERFKLIQKRKEQQELQQELEQKKIEALRIYQEQQEAAKKILEEKIGISCYICQKKKLKEDMYQTKDGFECQKHSIVTNINKKSWRNF